MKEQVSTNQREKQSLLEYIEGLDEEALYCFHLMIGTVRSGNKALMESLTSYFHLIGKNEGVGSPEPDQFLLSSIKTHVQNDWERDAWESLFSYPQLRGDPDCKAVAERAALCRLS